MRLNAAAMNAIQALVEFRYDEFIKTTEAMYAYVEKGGDRPDNRYPVERLEELVPPEIMAALPARVRVAIGLFRQVHTNIEEE